MQKQLLLILCLLSCAFSANAFTVVLDAGHGGHDAGAVGAFSKEKNINLKYTLEVGDLIKKNHPDVKVIYTRNKDVFVKLNERARIANRAKADLFISIHTNASKNKDANGMETFTLGASRSKENMEVAMLENSVILQEENYQKNYEGFDPNSVDSYIMFEFMKDQFMDRSITCADYIQQNMIAATKRNNRGVRQAGFLVLRATSMPSVLIELGFISNTEEEKFLNNSSNQTKICQAIYQAFANYKHDIDRKNGKIEEPVVAEQKAPQSTTATPATPTPAPKAEPATQAKPTVQAETAAQVTPAPAPTEAPTATPSNNSKEVAYYWQVLVSKNSYDAKNPIFKGLNIGNILHENNVYKYLVGPAYSKEAIELHRATVKEKFPDAFIVAYKNGQRIMIEQTK